jgi:hypothetical protein
LHLKAHLDKGQAKTGGVIFFYIEYAPVQTGEMEEILSNEIIEALEELGESNQLT